MRMIGEEVSKKFFGQVWDDIFGYLKVYDYLKMKIGSVIGNVKLISSSDLFWYCVLGDKFAGKEMNKFMPLFEGDIIRMKDMYLTEWVPKVPRSNLDKGRKGGLPTRNSPSRKDL